METVTFAEQSARELLAMPATVDALSSARLVEVYNYLANRLDLTEVKRFSTRATAERRILALVEQWRALHKVPELKAPASKAPASKAPASNAAITVASRCREMIRAGHTNAAIWKVIQKQFDLPGSKKSYPAWYRSDMKRRGVK